MDVIVSCLQPCSVPRFHRHMQPSCSLMTEAAVSPEASVISCAIHGLTSQETVFLKNVFV
jgi:hypothetical protein